jgi:hypothetical protein
MYSYLTSNVDQNCQLPHAYSGLTMIKKNLIDFGRQLTPKALWESNHFFFPFDGPI